MNASLLRALLTHIEDNPGRFDTTIYGETGRSCGPVADLAGWTLLLTGWELTADNTFRSPDGSREASGWVAIEHEACAALGLTENELWDGSDFEPLFAILGRAKATNRLRELTEQAEAATANA